MATLSEELADLAKLHAAGHLTDAEYNNAKAAAITKYKTPQRMLPQQSPSAFDQFVDLELLKAKIVFVVLALFLTFGACYWLFNLSLELFKTR